MLKPDSADRKGALIVFEGIDGCGKTSQAGFLMSWLKERKIHVDYSFEPTDGKYGKELRDSFSSAKRLSPQKELRLFQLDRLEHVNTVINPGLMEGWVVLVDRYFYSSMAYQGALGYKSPDEIYEQMTTFAPVPDMVLLFDVDIETALDRISNGRGEIPNLMEKQANLEAVKSIFNQMNYPEIVRLDANLSQKVIFDELLKVVTPLLFGKQLLRDSRFISS